MLKLSRTMRHGFTLIELLIVIAVIAILAAIAIPNLLSSRKSANEASAIGSLRTIISAEATYRARNNVYGTQALLSSTNLVDPALGAATSTAAPKSGFYYTVAIPSGSTTQFYAVADPVTLGGDRMFYTDETGVIWAAPFGTTDPSSDASGSGSTLGTAWSQIGN